MQLKKRTIALIEKNENQKYINFVLDMLTKLLYSNERVLIAINSPKCDEYMTLLKMLMQSTKISNARADALS